MTPSVRSTIKPTVIPNCQYIWTWKTLKWADFDPDTHQCVAPRFQTTILTSITSGWASGCRNIPPNLMACHASTQGFHKPKKIWTGLNRIRTNHGRCAASLYRWGRLDGPECDCGDEWQAIRHIVGECPRRAYGGTMDDFLMAIGSSTEYINTSNIGVCLWNAPYCVIFLHLFYYLLYAVLPYAKRNKIH